MREDVQWTLKVPVLILLFFHTLRTIIKHPSNIIHVFSVILLWLAALAWHVREDAQGLETTTPAELKTTLTLGTKVEINELTGNKKYGVVRWIGLYWKKPIVGLELVRFQKINHDWLQLTKVCYLYENYQYLNSVEISHSMIISFLLYQWFCRSYDDISWKQNLDQLKCRGRSVYVSSVTQERKPTLVIILPSTTNTSIFIKTVKVSLTLYLTLKI